MLPHSAFTVFLLTITSVAANLHFQNSDQCLCIKAQAQEEYYFECPRIHPTVLRVRVVPKEFAEITCQKDDMKRVTNRLPILKLEDLNYVIFKECPIVHANSTVILGKLGVTSTKYLNIEHALMTENITYDFIENFRGLEELSIIKSRIRYVDKKIFDALNNLTAVDLSGNRLSISEDLFENLKDLITLDLSGNSIPFLPSGIFSNLHKLQILHLWNNKVTVLEENTFANLTNLETLTLNGNLLRNVSSKLFQHLKSLKHLDFLLNRLEDLPEDLFRENRLLELVRISFNPLLSVLPEKMFANLIKLKGAFLDHCGFTVLPENLFENSVNIEEITLNENQLRFLPENLFSGLSRLRILNLENNKLINLPERIFSSLDNLKTLNLGCNMLKDFSNLLFYDLQRLEELNLKNNSIKSLPINSVQRMVRLKEVVLSYNDLRFETNGFTGGRDLSPFVNNVALERVDFSHNHINDIPVDFMYNKVHLKELNLSYNNITYASLTHFFFITKRTIMDLSNNNISTIDFSNYEMLLSTNAHSFSDESSNSKQDTITVIHLQENTLICDCRMIAFVRYLKDKNYKHKTNLIIPTENLRCTSPAELAGKKITDLEISTLTCPIELIDSDFNCPTECECKFMNKGKTLIIDCANRNLTEIPSLILPVNNFYDEIEVDLQGNFLKFGPVEENGFRSVTKLILSNNKIVEISWIPSTLHTLELENNSLRNLDSKMISVLNSTSLRSLSLGNNPWKCDCSIIDLKKYIISHFLEVKIDMNQIKCNNQNNDPLILMNDDVHCVKTSFRWMWFVIGGIAVTVIGFLTISVMFITKKQARKGS